MSALATTLQAFFTDRLVRQRQVSPNTVQAYRDTLRLLLVFASEECGKAPGKLDIDDLDAPMIGAFLNHLEDKRKNNMRTRNARLAAIRSLFRHAALRHPEHAVTIERVLAIPPKRFERRVVTYLTEAEIDALLAAPDRATWTGRRDTALFGLAVQTGLRASELIGLTCGNVHLGAGAHVSCTGKGRKQRITPLTSGTINAMRAWMAERAGQPMDPLFPTRTGRALSRDALERRLANYVADAQALCPTLSTKRLTMHVLRHSAAMRLLRAGIDTSVIALWLGHEQIVLERLPTDLNRSGIPIALKEWFTDPEADNGDSDGQATFHGAEGTGDRGD
jgi:integrase/recombinase XerD